MNVPQMLTYIIYVMNRLARMGGNVRVSPPHHHLHTTSHGWQQLTTSTPPHTWMATNVHLNTTSHMGGNTLPPPHHLTHGWQHITPSTPPHARVAIHLHLYTTSHMGGNTSPPHHLTHGWQLNNMHLYTTSATHIYTSAAASALTRYFTSHTNTHIYGRPLKGLS